MFKDNASFIVFALFLIVCWGRTSSECTPLTACSCVLEDGTIHDLSILSTLGLQNVTKDGSTYHFQPCKNVPMFLDVPDKLNECRKGVSLCANVTSEKAWKLVDIGTVQETRFLFPASATNKGGSFMIQHGKNVTKIELLCCVDCVTNFRLDSRNETQSHFVLTSSAVCHDATRTKGLSTGSILVILFFVFSGLYFLGGALVLKLTRGATGWEMLPNHDFWCELPSLVRDGIVFTCSFNRADSYDRI